MAKTLLRGLPRALRRLASLPAHERRFAVRAFVGAPVVEAALASFGLKRTVGFIDALPSPRPRPPTVEPSVAAVLVARVYRRHFVRGACLPRAVLQYALHRLDGLDATLEIGVKHGDDRTVEAHAWVRGDERDTSFTPLRRPGATALAEAS